MSKNIINNHFIPYVIHDDGTKSFLILRHYGSTNKGEYNFVKKPEKSRIIISGNTIHNKEDGTTKVNEALAHYHYFYSAYDLYFGNHYFYNAFFNGKTPDKFFDESENYIEYKEENKEKEITNRIHLMDLTNYYNLYREKIKDSESTLKTVIEELINRHKEDPTRRTQSLTNDVYDFLLYPFNDMKIILEQASMLKGEPLKNKMEEILGTIKKDKQIKDKKGINMLLYLFYEKYINENEYLNNMKIKEIRRNVNREFLVLPSGTSPATRAVAIRKIIKINSNIRGRILISEI